VYANEYLFGSEEKGNNYHARFTRSLPVGRHVLLRIAIRAVFVVPVASRRVRRNASGAKRRALGTLGALESRTNPRADGLSVEGRDADHVRVIVSATVRTFP